MTAYSPWANGRIGRVCREVLRACRALLSEFRSAPVDWPAVTECVQSILNHVPLKRLGNRKGAARGVGRTLIEVFTGQKPIRPILRALTAEKFPKATLATETDGQRLMMIDEMQIPMELMHKQVSKLTSASRRRQIRAHDRRTNVQEVNYSIGDFALIRKAKPGVHKISFAWVGPRRVISAKSALIFEVEDLLDGKKELVHARRLVLYCANTDGSDIDPDLLRAASHTESSYEIAGRLCEIMKKGDELFVRVQWEGLPDEADHTWESLKKLSEDIPDLLTTFLKSPGNNCLKNEALCILKF